MRSMKEKLRSMETAKGANPPPPSYPVGAPTWLYVDASINRSMPYNRKENVLNKTFHFLSIIEEENTLPHPLTPKPTYTDRIRVHP